MYMYVPHGTVMRHTERTEIVARFSTRCEGSRKRGRCVKRVFVYVMPISQCYEYTMRSLYRGTH